MTIQEAIQSGRPFRRPGKVYYTRANKKMNRLTTEDLLATDWEIREEPIGVLPSVLKKLLRKYFRSGVTPETMVEKIVEEIQFEEAA